MVIELLFIWKFISIFINYFFYLEWQKTCPFNFNKDQTTPASSTTTQERTEEKINYRLPRNLKPYFYEILIKPYFNDNNPPEIYTGHVVIKFRCLNDTSKLVLHMTENLEIDNGSFELKSLTQPSFVPIRQFTWIYDSKTQFLIINFDRTVFTKYHNYSVSIGFKGHVKDDNAGFYRSSYTDSNGNKK